MKFTSKNKNQKVEEIATVTKVLNELQRGEFLLTFYKPSKPVAKILIIGQFLHFGSKSSIASSKAFSNFLNKKLIIEGYEFVCKSEIYQIIVKEWNGNFHSQLYLRLVRKSFKNLLIPSETFSRIVSWFSDGYKTIKDLKCIINSLPRENIIVLSEIIFIIYKLLLDHQQFRDSPIENATKIFYPQMCQLDDKKKIKVVDVTDKNFKAFNAMIEKLIIYDCDYYHDKRREIKENRNPSGKLVNRKELAKFYLQCTDCKGSAEKSIFLATCESLQKTGTYTCPDSLQEFYRNRTVLNHGNRLQKVLFHYDTDLKFCKLSDRIDSKNPLESIYMKFIYERRNPTFIPDNTMIELFLLTDRFGSNCDVNQIAKVFDRMHFEKIYILADLIYLLMRLMNDNKCFQNLGHKKVVTDFAKILYSFNENSIDIKILGSMNPATHYVFKEQWEDAFLAIVKRLWIHYYNFDGNFVGYY